MANIDQSTSEDTNHNQITFVVPSNGDASRLREFTENAKQTLGARILKTVGTRKETIITFEGDKTITTANVLNKLVNMREVERVEENPSTNKRGREPQGILVILAH